jgi:hypothetical protein
MNIIPIDPGYAKKGEGCACAELVDGRLEGAWFLRPGDFRSHHYERHSPDVIIWERPQHRARDTKYSAVPPETLIALAIAGATLAGLYAGAYGAEVIEVHPSTWKGGLPKPVQHKALWDTLTDVERATFGDAQAAITRAILEAIERGARDRWAKDGASYYPRGFAAHNLLDAVGIGKWYLRQIGAWGK